MRPGFGSSPSARRPRLIAVKDAAGEQVSGSVGGYSCDDASCEYLEGYHHAPRCCLTAKSSSCREAPSKRRGRTNVACGNGCDANQEHRGGSNLNPDREIHGCGVVGNGCPS